MDEGRPLIIDKNGVRLCGRCGPKEPPFNEAKLQDYLRRYPEVLPVGDFEDSFRPLICIGRESRFGSCQIDNLYISPAGYVTLVETKLWKNAEQHREVIAQVLDYAKQLQTATYEDLDSVCRAYTLEYDKKEQSLAERVASVPVEDGPVDAQELADTVTKCLATGNFKILIVGDRIHENLIDLTEYLHGVTHLRLGLSLVEIACFKPVPGSTDELLLIPRLALRTLEVERAVVRVVLENGAEKLVSVHAAAPSPPRKGARPPSLDEEEFYEKLAMSIGQGEAGRAVSAKARAWVEDLKRELGLETEPKISRLMLKTHLPWDQETLNSVLGLTVDGYLEGNGGWANRLQKAGLPMEAVDHYCDGLAHIHTAFVFRSNDKGNLGWPKAPLVEVLPHLDRIKDVLRRFLSEIATAYETASRPNTK
jgi:hypothetical protein